MVVQRAVMNGGTAARLARSWPPEYRGMERVVDERVTAELRTCLRCGGALVMVPNPVPDILIVAMTCPCCETVYFLGVARL